jgi:hypothetical protein
LASPSARWAHARWRCGAALMAEPHRRARRTARAPVPLAGCGDAHARVARSPRRLTPTDSRIRHHRRLAHQAVRLAARRIPHRELAGGQVSSAEGAHVGAKQLETTRGGWHEGPLGMRRAQRELRRPRIVLPSMRDCATVRAVAAVDPDLGLRQAAVTRARELAQRYDDLVPLAQLQAGLVFDDQGELRLISERHPPRPHPARPSRAHADHVASTIPTATTMTRAARCSPTPTGPARSTRPTTAHSEQHSTCRRRSCTSAPWRPASTS